MTIPFTNRILPPTEYAKLIELGVPAEKLPPADGSLVAVVETAERIIGRWMAYNTVTLEGLCIDPEHQGKAVVARQLIVRMFAELRTLNVPAVVTLIETPDVEELAIHAGFVQLPGRLWQKDLRKL